MFFPMLIFCCWCAPGRPGVQQQHTCNNISTARCEQHFPNGTGVAPENHAVQAPCLLQGSGPGHEGTSYVAASTHLLLLVTQPALHSKQHCYELMSDLLHHLMMLLGSRLWSRATSQLVQYSCSTARITNLHDEVTDAAEKHTCFLALSSRILSMVRETGRNTGTSDLAQLTLWPW